MKMRTQKIYSMGKRNAGVTLMELLVVVVIIGILASLAVPAYRNYILRGNRADAKAALLSVAGTLERCYTRFNSYTAAAGCTQTFPVISPEGHYSIAATTRTDIAFTLTATPQARQADDTQCGNFTLTSANVKDVSGGTPWQQCWGR